MVLCSISDFSVQFIGWVLSLKAVICCEGVENIAYLATKELKLIFEITFVRTDGISDLYVILKSRNIRELVFVSTIYLLSYLLIFFMI